MKSPFTQFQGGGIEPNPNIAATGRFLGEMAYKSFSDAGNQLAEGLKQYQKNAAEDDYLTESLSLQATDLAKWSSIVSQDPKYAPMLDGLMPMMEKASKGPSMSLNQKRALNSQLGAFLKAVPDDLRTIDTVAANQERETAIEADRQGMLGNLTALRNAWSGDPSKSSLLPDIDAQIGNLSGARDRQGKLAALAQSKNYFTLLPELKDAANRSALFNANQTAPDIAAGMATLLDKGTKKVPLRDIPLTKEIEGRQVPLTPQELVDQTNEELSDSNIDSEQKSSRIFENLKAAKEAILSAKGIEPSVQTEWANQFDEAINGATSDYQTRTLNIGATNRGRATEVVSKQLQEQIQGQEDPVEVRITNKDYEEYTSLEFYSKSATEKGRTPVVQNGKTVGFEVPLVGLDGKPFVVGVAKNLQEEKKLLEDYRRDNLHLYAQAIDKLAEARGLVKGSAEWEKLVGPARLELQDAILDSNYPKEIVDANGKKIPNPRYLKAQEIRKNLSEGTSITRFESKEDKEIFWDIIKIGAATAGVTGAGEALWRYDPLGAVSKLVGTKTTFKSPDDFIKWYELQVGLGKIEETSKLAAIVSGRGDRLLRGVGKYIKGNVMTFDHQTNKYVDPSGQLKPEVVEAATVYRNAETQAYTAQYQQWKAKNPNGVPSIQLRATWDAESIKQAEAAVRARSIGVNGKPMTSEGIRAAMSQPHFENAVKTQNPEVHKASLDSTGKFDPAKARTLLPKESLTSIDTEVAKLVQHELSPITKAAEEIAAARSKIGKWLGGDSKVKRYGGIAAITTAIALSTTDAAADTAAKLRPEWTKKQTTESKALDFMFGQEGKVQTRLKDLTTMEKAANESKEKADALRTSIALKAQAGGGGTQNAIATGKPSQVPTVSGGTISVPNIEEIPRQQKITNLSNELMRKTGVSAADANAIASQWYPQQAGPSVVRVNGIDYYSGNGGTDWKPVPAENIKAAGGSASNFSAVYYGTKAINPVTNKIEIAPVNLGPFSVIGAKPENATERMNLDSKFKIAAIGLRAAEKIREEMKQNPVRGGFININGANTEIKQRYLSIFSSLLEQSGQGERPSDRDVQNINEAVAKVSDYFTRDNTGMKGLQAYVEDTRFALQNEAKLSGLQISFVRSPYFDTGDDLTSLTSEARTSVLK